MAKRHEKKKEAARRMREQQKKEQRQRQLKLGGGIVAIVLLVAAVAGVALYLNQGYEVNDPKAKTADGALVVGDGPVKVDIYADYICPNCKQFEDSSAENIDKAIADGDITLNFHPLGLLDKASSTKYSSRAAASAVCAADEGPEKFMEYSKALFQNQPPEGGEGLPDEKLVSIGSDVGLGGSFKKCVNEDKYRGWVNEETSNAASDGITGTPTVKIDDEKLENYSEFNDRLAKAVEGAKGDKADEKKDESS